MRTVDQIASQQTFKKFALIIQPTGESDDCMVQENVLEDNQDGVAIETWCWDLPTASENRVVKNDISEGQVGVSVDAYAWSYSTGDSMADNNKVVNNIIEDQEDYGVLIGAWYLSGSYTASADNNKAIRNIFSECTEEIEDGVLQPRAMPTSSCRLADTIKVMVDGFFPSTYNFFQYWVVFPFYRLEREN